MKQYQFKGLLIFSVILLILCITMQFSYSAEKEKIRVGYFDYQELFTKNDKGLYLGYSKQYLDEIAKYTGWDYEFVPGSLGECFERLKNGEIDLLCAIQYSDERAKFYEYPTYSMGMEYAVLYVLPDNDNIYYEDFNAFNGIKVGLLKSSHKNELFDEYMKEHNFSVEKHYYDSYAELKNALHNHEVDSILSGSLDGEKNDKIVAQFSAMPFYIISTKGNNNVINKLNFALEHIKIEKPYFEMQLYKKYYCESVIKLKLKREDVEFIKNSPPLRIICNSKLAPLEYFDSQTNDCAGVYVDIVKLMLDCSKIKYEFITSESLEDSLAKIKNGEADILLSVYASDVIGKEYNIKFTDPYIQEKNVLVGRKGMIFDEAAILSVAILKENMDFKYLIAEKYPFWQVQVYDTLEECFAAIESGQVDLSLQNENLILNYFSKNNHDNIGTITALDTEIPISLGMSKNLPKEMAEILNKSVLTVSKKEINNIIMKNTLNKVEQISTWEFIKQKRLAIALCLFVSIAVLMYIINLIKRNKEQELAKAAYTDALTGVKSLEKFKIDANNIIRNFNPCNYAVIYIDIEKFKYINESFGYERGNAVLIYFAKLFMYQLYSDEIFGRVSGDRFVALMKFESKEILAERLESFYHIVDSIRTTMLDNNRLTLVSGVYCLTKEDSDISLAIDRANLARKTAKGLHHSSFVFYDHKIHNQVIKEKEIENIMEKALHNKEFIIYLQPKYDLKSRKIIGAEALARWQKADGNIILPNDFIPVFERNGFINEFDFYIFRQVCSLQQKWEAEGKKILPIAVNFSRIHIDDKNFIDKIEEILDEYKTNPRNIEIEMTESAFVESDQNSSTIISDLQNIGFTLTMDDFGTGYSSLNLLKDASFDILKLDKSFLVDKEVSVKEKILISNIIHMAKELNIKVIAEGIETAEQEAFLTNLSCDMGQGYYFSRPITIAEFEKMVGKE